MSPPLPRPSLASLTHLLSAAQRPNNPKRISFQQLQRYVTPWFPRELWGSIYGGGDSGRAASSLAHTSNRFKRFCKDPPLVSPVWSAALQLVDLSRCVATPMRGATTAVPANPTIWTIEHLLRCGVFPPAGWVLTLRLLQVWRDEQSNLATMSVEASPSHEGCSTGAVAATERLGDSSRLSFPPRLSPAAAAQLLHHISLAPPSTQRWQDALRLYQCSAAQTYMLSERRRMTDPSRVLAAGASPATTPTVSAFLKALRHMTLTTLLQAGEWERGLRFYSHALYQRDVPGTVTTGYLVQVLGKAGRWASVVQVYELCVKLLHVQRRQRLCDSPGRAEVPSRAWGTTLSMAMAAALSCPAVPPTVLWTMLRQLRQDRADSESSSPLPPLVRLDGNFLSAVQALATADDRTAVLRFAKQEGLLDVFKLIRGLLSKHRWEEALLLFTEAVKATAAPTPSSRKDARSADAGIASGTTRDSGASWPPVHLSRREIGEARLGFLHSCTIHNVVTVVAVLNRHHATRRGSGDGVTSALALNDQEVECVLSKTLEASEASCTSSRCASDFWQYCLQLLDRNYTPAATTSPSPSSHWRSVAEIDAAPHRQPTAAALSFLLRHPRLPWHVALQLIETYNLLGTGRGTGMAPHPHSKSERVSRGVDGGGRSSHDVSVTSRALALNAAVSCLASQGQHEAAEGLALRALHAETFMFQSSGSGVSLSAALLRIASPSTLHQLLLARHYDRLYVDGRVLFHLLREGIHATESDGVRWKRNSTTATSAEKRRDVLFVDHPCGRALTVVHLLMLRGIPPRDTPSAAGGPHPIEQLPASLFLFEPTSSANASSLQGAPEAASLSPWLLAYPSSVHCEVVRAICCITAGASVTTSSDLCAANPSSDSEARECYTQRWTWTTRYLHMLTDFFVDQPQRCVRSSVRCPSRHPLLPTGDAAAVEAAVEAAREAYYVSTFEAVISLLETTAVQEAPSTSDSITAVCRGDTTPRGTEVTPRRGGENMVDGAPRTSRNRVQFLCDTLERAIVRYRCVPPTHMFLPNQLDRLLPPLTQLSGLAMGGGKAARGAAQTQAQERCAVAACLLRLAVRSLNTSDPNVCIVPGASGRPRTVEPALLHGLLKLCCRVAEYEKALASSSSSPCLQLRTGGDSADDTVVGLCEVGGALVRLQVEQCGLATIQPGTLSLLYHLCAAVQECQTKIHPSLPKKVALETTGYLLRHGGIGSRAALHRVWRHRSGASCSTALHAGVAGAQQPSAAAVPLSEREGGDDGGRGSASAVAVKPRHCELFFSLFGWEDTLHVWYPAFPRDVLRLLANDPRAIEACLSLEESSQE
jgi:hypothetical protein